MIAKVKLWGAEVGLIAWDANRNCATFEYSAEFLDMGVEPAPIYMPLSQSPYIFASLNNETYRGLPGMLADSLPDKFGNSLIDQWLAESRRTPSSFSSVDRLMYVGKRGMGALEFYPVNSGPQVDSLSLDIQELVELSCKVLAKREAQKFELNSQNTDDNIEGLEKILAVGTSAGGARAKAIIAWNQKTDEVRSGQVNAGEGFDYWLLKFDGVSDNRDKELADPKGYGRIEYAYHLMALEAGIEMSTCRLMEENGRAHFMTKRFDRIPGGQKLHMQSLCALGHYDFNEPGATSYEQALFLCDQMGLDASAKEQLFLRMVFNALAFNRDDHTKQISFLMDKAGQWSLSPAYDVTYAYNPAGKYTNGHQMTINRKRKDIRDEDFIAVAERQGIHSSTAKRAVASAKESISMWTLHAEAAGVSDIHYDKISRLINPQ